MLRFKKYTAHQIFDILKFRADLAFRKGTISDEVIHLISNIIQQSGDLRYGLDLLLSSGKFAELRNFTEIDPECVRYANNKIISTVSKENIQNLPKHPLILLLSIIRCLKRNNQVFHYDY